MILKKLPGINGNTYSSSRYLYSLINSKENIMIANTIDDISPIGVLIFADRSSINDNKLIEYIKTNFKYYRIGNFFGTIWKSPDSITFNKKSIGIELYEETDLLKTAEFICREFDKKEALIKEYKSGYIWLIIT